MIDFSCHNKCLAQLASVLSTIKRDTLLSCSQGAITQDRANFLLSSAPLIPPQIPMQSPRLRFDTLTDHIRWYLLSPQTDTLAELADELEEDITDSKNSVIPFDLFPALLERVSYSVRNTDLVARFARTMSEVVCDRLEDCSPENAVHLISLLTNRKLPLDEFWLFMLAKRVQQSIDGYDANQVTTIADCFSSRKLEDDEFFRTLTKRLQSIGIEDLKPDLLARFIYACGCVRYRDPEMLTSVLQMYQGRWTLWSAKSTAHLIAGLTQLDALDIPGVNEVMLLLNLDTTRAAPHRGFIVEHFLLTAMYFRLGILALPHLISHLNLKFAKDEGRFLRRFIFMVKLAETGALFENAERLPIAVLRTLRELKNVVEDSANYGFQQHSYYEPVTSGFQIEVCSMLKIMGVEHELEVKRLPFIMDVLIPGMSGSTQE